jgi:hypothetical protein
VVDNDSFDFLCLKLGFLILPQVLQRGVLQAWPEHEKYCHIGGAIGARRSGTGFAEKRTASAVEQSVI